MEVKQTHITIEKDKIEQVIQWAEKHGEIVFAGGGMDAVDSMNVFVESLRRSVAKAEKQEPVAVIKFLKRLSQQTPEKPDYWSSCGQCERNANEAEELLESTHPQPKPSPLTDEQIDYSIKKNDIVTSKSWSLTELIVVDVNWALGAVAVQLGYGGGIVVWPALSLKKEAAHNQRN